LPKPEPFEGRSLVGLMRGREDAQERPVFGAATATWNESGQMRHYVRDSRWKFVSEDPGGQTALYDLAGDPEEIRDVSAAHQDVAKRLSGVLTRHLQRLLARPQ